MNVTQFFSHYHGGGNVNQVSLFTKKMEKPARMSWIISLKSCKQ